MMQHVRLSARENEVLSYFARGLTYTQISRRLGIAVATVDTYLRRVRAKTGAASGAELIMISLKLQSEENEEITEE